MAEEKSQPSSPVCYLAEADDLYAGYLTPDEIEALIRQWIERAPRAEIARLLTALLPPEAAATMPPKTAPSEAVAEAVAIPDEPLPAAIRRALPRIRDDALHGALTRIADLA
jgi:hypothetical protein